jgi:hypothetical protein
MKQLTVNAGESLIEKMSQRCEQEALWTVASWANGYNLTEMAADLSWNVRHMRMR